MQVSDNLGKAWGAQSGDGFSQFLPTKLSTGCGFGCKAHESSTYRALLASRIGFAPSVRGARCRGGLSRVVPCATPVRRDFGSCACCDKVHRGRQTVSGFKQLGQTLCFDRSRLSYPHLAPSGCTALGRVCKAFPQSYPQSPWIRVCPRKIKHLAGRLHASVRICLTHIPALHAPVPTAPEAPCRVGVVVEAPQHSGLWGALDYLHPQTLPAGALVRVPLGRRVVTGVVWDPVASQGDVPPESLKAVLETFEALPPLPEAWRKLVAFAAAYYQRSLGERALMVLPPELRQLDQVQLARRLKRLDKAVAAELAAAGKAAPGHPAHGTPGGAPPRPPP